MEKIISENPDKPEVAKMQADAISTDVTTIMAESYKIVDEYQNGVRQLGTRFDNLPSLDRTAWDHKVIWWPLDERVNGFYIKMVNIETQINRLIASVDMIP